MRHQFIRRAAALVLALTLTVSLAAPVCAAVEDGIKLSQTELSLTTGKTVTLTAEIPAADGTEGNAGGGTVEWSSSDTAVVTVEASGGSIPTATVTARSAGEATITAKAGNLTATCAVTVTDPGITINGSALWGKNPSDADRTYTVELNGLDDVANPQITWSAQTTSAQAGVVVPKFSGDGAKNNTDTDGNVISTTVTGTTVTIKEQTAGEFYITAEYVYNGVTYSDTLTLTISGLVLTGGGGKLDPEQKTLDMVINGSATLGVDAYGSARPSGSTALNVDWSSSDAAVVSVMPKVGILNAWRDGKAVITVATADGDYSAYCTVTVKEDESVIADRYPNTENGKRFTASVSEPLILSNVVGGYQVYSALNEICKTKTAEHAEYEYPDATPPVGYGLSYITNLKVPTDQGTLYYNYSTEADTGAGVGYTDQFALTAGGSKLSLDRLYFVPKPGVSGTVDITFTGVATNGRNFSGVIRVEVGSGGEISYRAQAGEPVWFASSDFEAYCQSVNGRTYNYIIFNLPKSSEGVLYYNYVANSGNPVTTTTRFTPSGRYTLDDVCFVPNAAYQGKSVTITFRGVDTSGAAISGEVEVTVIQSGTVNDSANVNLSGERGQPVTLHNNLFNDACRATLGDTLDFVTFTLPDPTVGTLYVNYRGVGDYDSRVTAGTRCYYSGTPGLSSVSFVPATSAAGQVAISYTGYGIGGASFSGTLYITLEDVDRSTIYYSVIKGGTVNISVSDFNTAGRQAVGSNVTFVVFTKISSGSGLGTLRYRYSSTYTPSVSYYANAANATSFSSSASYLFYASPTGSTQRGLGTVFFEANKTTTGTITISYVAFSGTASKPNKLFEGEVKIQVTSLQPKDIVLSCKTSGQVSLSASTVNSVCSAVMSKELSYIEITSVPSAKKGHLYYNYSGFGTGTVVEPRDRFYRVGSPGIDRLTFIPYARFSGTAEITYIGYSSDGQELVSGRILVKVSKTADSHFNDMAGASWAIDAVEYLYRNGKIVKGVGGGRFNPTGTVTKGDFTLMLVRAYKLTATGSVFFSDVPSGSYYADAIRIAALKGIVSGSGDRFNPDAPLTRQEAFVMLYNTLKVSGKTAANGLAADLSAYHDEGSIDSAAREATGILVKLGVVKGDNGYLRPRNQLSRAEAAVLLHAMMTL